MLTPPRHFNNISIINDNVIRKSSKDYKKIVAEYEWLTSSTHFQHPNASNLILNKDGASYDIEYIHGRTLSKLFTSPTLSRDEFYEIFKYIKEIIDFVKFKGVSARDKGNLEIVASMYEEKTLSRLSEYGIDLNAEYTFNNVNLGTLNNIIKSSEVIVSSDDLCYIHGDMCFSNIILSDEYFINNDTIRKYLYFIDPRGLLPNGIINQTGDYRYDIGKLAHSVIGKYDYIKSNLLVANKISSTCYELDYKDSVYDVLIENAFTQVFNVDETIYNIMIHLFLSMVPLHSDNERHQDTMIANALRLYTKKLELFK